MGIFDALTGDAASAAADKNRQNLGNLLTTGTNIYGEGYGQARSDLGNALTAYQPVSNLANQYAGGTTMYLNALGLNGQAGSDTARAAFQQNPGYEYTLNQGLEAINRRRAAGGMLNSGNADVDATNYATNLANQGYNTWLQNLSGLNNNALTATNAAASGKAGIYGGLAGLAQQNAGNLVGLNTNVTNGINSQNTQQANAETAASGNILGLGLNLAKLGTGFVGGGGSLGGMGLGSGSTAMTTGRLF